MLREQLVDRGITVNGGNRDGLYVIYDRAAQQAGPIFSAATDAVAVRQYRRLVDEQRIDIEEYSLLCVGYFDRQELCVIDECKVVFDAEDYRAAQHVERVGGAHE